MLLASVSFGQQQDHPLTWLPDQTLMPAFTANATAHRISLTRLLKNSEYIGSMGGMFPVVSGDIAGHETQFNIGATAYTQLNRSGRHTQVSTIDYFVDFVADVDLRQGRVLRLGIGHTSQHFVDDAFEVLGYQYAINYVRDYLEAFLSQKLALIRGYVYGGFLYHYRFVIPQPGKYHWLFEVGGEGVDYELARNLYAYVALDVKFREESGFATTQDYQLGVRLNGEKGRTIRLAYAYRTGLEERGQFYQQRTHWNTLGLFFEF
jgi:hypothetical protein